MDTCQLLDDKICFPPSFGFFEVKVVGSVQADDEGSLLRSSLSALFADDDDDDDDNQPLLTVAGYIVEESDDGDNEDGDDDEYLSLWNG